VLLLKASITAIYPKKSFCPVVVAGLVELHPCLKIPVSGLWLARHLAIEALSAAHSQTRQGLAQAQQAQTAQDS
jgi:hypothetical protein